MPDLEAVAAQCRELRRRLGKGAVLWTTTRLAAILHATVVDHGWPAENAVTACSPSPRTRR